MLLGPWKRNNVESDISGASTLSFFLSHSLFIFSYLTYGSLISIDISHIRSDERLILYGRCVLRLVLFDQFDACRRRSCVRGGS